jgi:hypothetical protein
MGGKIIRMIFGNFWGFLCKMIGEWKIDHSLTYIGDVGKLGPIGMRHVALDL